MEIICKDVPLGILTKIFGTSTQLEKIQYSNPNALAKIFVNNTVFQTKLTNKFIDNCPPKILNCLKIGITKFFNLTKKGRPCKYISDEERNEHKKEYDKKYYEQHKKSTVIVKA